MTLGADQNPEACTRLPRRPKPGSRPSPRPQASRRTPRPRQIRQRNHPAAGDPAAGAIRAASSAAFAQRPPTTLQNFASPPPPPNAPPAAARGRICRPASLSPVARPRGERERARRRGGPREESDARSSIHAINRQRDIHLATPQLRRAARLAPNPARRPLFSSPNTRCAREPRARATPAARKGAPSSSKGGALAFSLKAGAAAR